MVIALIAAPCKLPVERFGIDCNVIIYPHTVPIIEMPPLTIFHGEVEAATGCIIIDPGSILLIRTTSTSIHNTP